ncbi:MAG: hypothetical protein KG075_12550 [Alphaproteobacteria bacterium]|nr:hypothetical protein [Alphaproteobacteria bacterium]
MELLDFLEHGKLINAPSADYVEVLRILLSKPVLYPLSMANRKFTQRLIQAGDT